MTHHSSVNTIPVKYWTRQEHGGHIDAFAGEIVGELDPDSPEYLAGGHFETTFYRSGALDITWRGYRTYISGSMITDDSAICVTEYLGAEVYRARILPTRFTPADMPQLRTWYDDLRAKWE